MDTNYQKYLFSNQQQPYFPQPQENTYNFDSNLTLKEPSTQQIVQSQDSEENDQNYAQNYFQTEFDREYNKDLLKSQIQFIREKLIVMGLPKIGDLFSTNFIEVEKTVKCLYALIQQIIKDFDFRNNFHDQLQKVMSERNHLQLNFERINQLKTNLENEVSHLTTKFKIQEKTNKEQMQTIQISILKIRQKLCQEKDELQKNLAKTQSMKAQYEHEIKSRDLNLQKIQEHLKRVSFQKLSNLKNSFELVEQMEANGPPFFTMNVKPPNLNFKDTDFSQATLNQWIEINKKAKG